MSIPRSNFSRSEKPTPPPSGNAQRDSPEDDFEAFMIAPADLPLPGHEHSFSRDSQAEAAQAVETRQAPRDDDASPAVRAHADTAAIRTERQANVSPAKPSTGGGEPIREPATTKGSKCQMPDKPPAQAVSTAKPAGPHTAFAAAGSETTAAQNIGPITAHSESLLQGSPEITPPSAARVPHADATSEAGLPAAAGVPGEFVTAFTGSAQTFEFDIDGSSELNAETVASISSELFTAAGSAPSPPARASFAEIAEILRAGNETIDSTIAGDASAEVPESANAGDAGGSSAFSDTGANSMLQQASTPRSGQADSAALARSIQHIESQILHLSSANLKDGGRSMRIRLDYAGLGPVEITLVRHEGGAMSAHLVTDTESSRQSLNENIAQLRNSLENAGLRLHELDISCRSFSAAGQGDSQGRGGENAGSSLSHTASTKVAGGISEDNGESDIRLLNLRA